MPYPTLTPEQRKAVEWWLRLGREADRPIRRLSGHQAEANRRFHEMVVRARKQRRAS